MRLGAATTAAESAAERWHGDHPAQNRWKKLLTLLAAAVFLAGLVGNVMRLAALGLLFALSLAAGTRDARRSVAQRKITINLLVTIAALGALYLGEIVEAAVVMFFSR